MKSMLIAVGALAVLLAACGGPGDAGVATLDDAEGVGAIVEDGPVDAAGGSTDEEALLDFAQCMREQGVEDFEDPDVDADGSLNFRFRGQGQTSDVDPDTIRAAFTTCQEHLEGLAFGPGSRDRSEIEDRLYDFAACMRDPDLGNLSDFPDPDFSNFGPGQGGGAAGGGPFGEDFDFSDPAVQDALTTCQDVFGGFRFGGGPGARPNRDGADA